MDFHNALVALLGEEEGKRLYQELKTNAGMRLTGQELPAYGLKEKFDMYCKMVLTTVNMQRNRRKIFRDSSIRQTESERISILSAQHCRHYGKTRE